MSRVIKKHGFTIDVSAIAAGVFRMMPEDERLPLVLGMMPAKWNEIVERMVREKIGGEHEARYGFKPDDGASFAGVDFEPTGTYKDFVREIMHEFYLGMLDEADKAKILVV